MNQPKPTQDTQSQIFLSPRVIDRAAFEEFGASLKSMIQQASESGKALTAAAGSAEAVQKRLTEIGPSLETRLAAASAALASIESRAAEATNLYTKAATHAATVSQAEARIGQLVGDKIAAVESRMAQLEEATKIRVEALKAQGQSILLGVQESLEQTLRQSAEKMQSLDAGVSTKIARALDRAQADAAELETRLSQISGRVANLAGPGLAGLTALCDRAAAILGYEPGENPAGAAAGSLTETAVRAERISSEATTVLGQLEQLRQRADATRAALARTVDDISGLAVDLAGAQNAIRQGAENAMAQCAAATTELVAKAHEFQTWTAVSQMVEAKPIRKPRTPRAKVEKPTIKRTAKAR